MPTGPAKAARSIPGFERGNARAGWRLRPRHDRPGEQAMGRNVTMSVGALIVIIIIVALIF
jgi:hypothetical protein